MQILFVIYICLLVILLFGDDIFTRNANKYELINHTNLVPFAEIKRYLNAFNEQTIPLWNIICNLLGNFVLFMPLMWFAGRFKPVYKKWYISLPICAIIIICVEWMQYYFKRGSMDVDDFILNFSGCVTFAIIDSVIHKKSIVKWRSNENTD